MLWFAASFEPKNWAYCDGRLINISQNSALFSLLGTTYGGNGVQTFALPDFRGRTVIGTGNGTGLSSYQEGQTGGSNGVSLLQSNMPLHTHTATPTLRVSNTASDGDEGPGNLLGNADIYAAGQNGNLGGVTAQPTSIAGSGAPVPVEQPYLGMNFIICLYGIFPSRN